MIQRRIGKSLLIALAIALVPVVLTAEVKRNGKVVPGQFNPNDETVDVFDAIEADQVEVKLIPRDSVVARIIVTNKTGKPLNVQLPEVFAGVPVLAQAFGGGGCQGGGQQQGIGGGGGGGEGGGGQGGGGGGFFMNVAPEKTMDMKVGVVCLEHGKPEPSPAGNYVLKPITALSNDANVHEMLRQFGQGNISHASAQAAAWHLANNMSWEELANKRIKKANGTSYPYFSADELQQAVALVAVSKQKALERSQTEPSAASLNPAK